MRVKCLSCDAENDALATGGYCESCGKKLPSSAQVKTRRTLGGDMAESAEVVPLPARTKAVSEGLFAAAVVYLFAGGLFLIVGPSILYSTVPDQFAPIVLTWTILPALLLGVLGVLARWIPLPAVWLAVALGVVWVAATFFVNSTIATGWLLVDAALFGVLAWAVWLGLRPEKRTAG